MKITRKQLRQIIAEEKQKLHEISHLTHTVFNGLAIADLLLAEAEDYVNSKGPNSEFPEGMTEEELTSMRAAVMKGLEEVERYFGRIN